VIASDTEAARQPGLTPNGKLGPEVTFGLGTIVGIMRASE